jgi:tetratricopeptide (TPR) repeat protein
MADDTKNPTCPNCGAKNAPDARFCRTCGELLNEAQPALVASAASAAAGTLNREITSITDPLLKIVDTSPDALIVASLQQVLDEAGPRQAEVLRRCAIPRWFDLGVLAVLRERDDGNERVLELLRGYSFVRQIGDERYAYHDAVREALLKDWRERRPGELRAINMRLAEHFGDRVTTTEGLRALPKSLPLTTVSAAPAGDWDLWARESLYHRLLADPRDGMERLHVLFDQMEANHRLADAEAVLQVARDAPLEETERLWLRYLHARLDHAALRLDEAAAQLEQILAQPVLDPLLAAEARQTMGEIHAETGQWARATELYRDGLGYFEACGKRHQAAEAMLRLGEAYQGLGLNTGGWHVPAYPRSTFWRVLGQSWQWLLSLPFLLVAFFLRRTPWTLPRPEHLASYQNWLLVRLYRTAQDWYERARDAFADLGDDAGGLRAEQHLAEILLIFGYVDDALKRLDALRMLPAARDPYVRLWIDCGRAAALLAKGQVADARAILDEALPRFRELGDIRREAAVLALQARAAEIAGDADRALEHYRDSLTRFRALRYTAAREQALYALRAWRRHVGPGPISKRIGALLAEEPEKRYVARFPRSQIPLLQVLSLAAIPLALLLLAVVLPDQTVRAVAGRPLPELLTSYSPWRALSILTVLVLLYSAAYTVVALAVIFFIPIGALEREQPDYLITDPEGIARYDYKGERAERLRWDEIRRWIRVDRRLWERPFPLFSMTFLEAADGRDLRIDGITGWYTSVQDDIGRHLHDARAPIVSEDLGFRILRSKMSVLPLIGLPLLVLFLAAESGWADWLVLLLPPPVYAASAFVVFSGALILIALAYWLATKPLALHRAIGPKDRWPQIIGVAGLGAIALYVLARGATFQQTRSLYIGLLIWGAYIAADAATTLLAPRNRTVRLIAIVAAVAVALVIVFPRIEAIYTEMLNQVAARRVVLLNESQPAGTGAPPPAMGSVAQAVEAGDTIANEPQYSPEQKAQAYINKGSTYYAIKDYRSAAREYREAVDIYEGLQGTDSEAVRQGRAVALAGYARSLQKLGDRDWVRLLAQACAFDPSVASECSNQ